MTEEDIDKEGFRKYVPKFVKRGNKKMTYLDRDHTADKGDKWDWENVEEPDEEGKREIVQR
jgi:hypothetical protein